MINKRRQLTLFIDSNAAATIEQLRRQFNPLQYALIKAHVTLSREDELNPIEKVMSNLMMLHNEPVSIEFGKPIRFSENNGVLIPAIGTNESFQELRKNILKDIVEEPRRHEPHITLMHPRNSTCTDILFEQISKFSFPNIIQFKKISLVEQEMGKQWQLVKEFELIKQ